MEYVIWALVLVALYTCGRLIVRSFIIREAHKQYDEIENRQQHKIDYNNAIKDIFNKK